MKNCGIYSGNLSANFIDKLVTPSTLTSRSKKVNVKHKALYIPSYVDDHLKTLSIDEDFSRLQTSHIQFKPNFTILAKQTPPKMHHTCVVAAAGPWRRRRQSCTRPDAKPTRLQRTLVHFASALSPLYQCYSASDFSLSSSGPISSRPPCDRI